VNLAGIRERQSHDLQRAINCLHATSDLDILVLARTANCRLRAETTRKEDKTRCDQGERECSAWRKKDEAEGPRGPSVLEISFQSTSYFEISTLRAPRRLDQMQPQLFHSPQKCAERGKRDTMAANGSPERQRMSMGMYRRVSNMSEYVARRISSCTAKPNSGARQAS
jgi:hypothetical protein